MKKPKKGSLYRAMPLFSQGCTEDVLFIKNGVSPDSLYEVAYSRLEAVSKLLNFASQVGPNGLVAFELSVISDAAGILVTDAMSVIEGLHSSANKRP
jgi:hypothetical protein